MELRTARGDKIEVRDATGQWLPRRATSEVDPGHTFPVVWACPESEWDEAQAAGREPDAAPWPAEDVRATEREMA